MKHLKRECVVITLCLQGNVSHFMVDGYTDCDRTSDSGCTYIAPKRIERDKRFYMDR